jgi:enoyl-CoA hydratase/carnithine racemase
MSESADEFVLVTTNGAVRTLTLNNPARRNAWNLDMEARYFALLDEADNDPEVRAIVVTGTGAMFCPGMDSQYLMEAASAGSVDRAQRRPQMYALSIRKPMIAAVNGGCAGIGLCQALACDIRFASADARFAAPYSRRGLPAEYGMSWLLPRLIGIEHALDMLLSGRGVPAREAKDIGLVSRVLPPEGLLGAAQEYAAELASYCAPRSMAVIRQQVYGDLSRQFSAATERALDLMSDFARSEDFGEGVASFVEKRPPRFLGLDPACRTDGDLGW